jgi:hypothetical protein
MTILDPLTGRLIKKPNFAEEATSWVKTAGYPRSDYPRLPRANLYAATPDLHLVCSVICIPSKAIAHDIRQRRRDIGSCGVSYSD